MNDLRGNTGDARGETLRRRAIGCAALLLVLSVAAGLRFYRLSDQGILGVDEGRYILDALSKRAELAVCGDIARGRLAELRGGPEFVLADHVRAAHAALAAQHPFAPKPGFAYASALLMLATGNVINACSYLEAWCGVATVLAVFLFVWRLRNARAGLIAAGLLAVSVYHVYFSRNAYPQCSAGLLFLIAVCCHLQWYRASRRPTALHMSADDSSVARVAKQTSIITHLWLVCCGIFAGLSLWFNYQVAGVLPALPLIHLALGFRRGRFLTCIAEMIAIGLGFGAVMLLAEAQTYPFILLFRSHGMTYPHGTFFELLTPRVLGQSDAPWNGTGWVLFPYFLSVFEGNYYAGAVVIALLLGGLYGAYATLRTGRVNFGMLLHPAVVYVAVPVAVAYGVFSFKTMQGARTFVTVLPFVLAGVAITVDAAMRSRIRWFRDAMVGPLLFALFNLFLYYPGRLNEVLTIRSAYPDVVQFAREQQPPAACAGWSAVLEAYGARSGLETGSVYHYANSGKPLPPYVSDWQELYNRRMPDQPIAIDAASPRAKEFEHRVGRVFLTVEAFPSFGDTFKNIAWAESLGLERARQVILYRAANVSVSGAPE